MLPSAPFYISSWDLVFRYNKLMGGEVGYSFFASSNFKFFNGATDFGMISRDWPYGEICVDSSHWPDALHWFKINKQKSAMMRNLFPLVTNQSDLQWPVVIRIHHFLLCNFLTTYGLNHKIVRSNFNSASEIRGQNAGSEPPTN